MILGCAWYPEHWPETRWRDDLALMRDAGITMVRVAEFAWSRLEPEEGRFEFDWLERSIALAAEYGMISVVGTPTAAPPAWLTHRYPDTLAVRADGRRAVHGHRCHYSPTSGRYRQFCRRIAEEMAKRFGKSPHVVGWQIDNEYNSLSFDAETQKQFQAWLKERYASLDALNEHWTTAYWSQEYSEWEQIPLPTYEAWEQVNPPTYFHNPGLALDVRRFMTYVYRTFQHEQIEVIRAHAEPRQWITHNFMGWFDAFDHYQLTEELDLVSWDNYVGTGHLKYPDNGAAHDLMRGLKRKNFWLIETQPGSVNWSTVNNHLDRGEVRAMAWHAVGHGADAVSYWQWRSALGGQEQFHGSLVAPDGLPRPVYTEAAQLGKAFAQVADLLADTAPAAPVAILHSYDNRWAVNYQRHHREFQPIQHLLTYYRPLRLLALGVDIVHPETGLDDYRLVIAPHLNILYDELAEHLVHYVQRGGHLVLGARSGMKDRYNALLPSRQPGPLASTLGAHVEEYFALDQPAPVSGLWGEGSALIWAEWLQRDEPDVEILLRYGPANGWLDEQAAMVTRKVGAGRITYLGAWLDAGLMRRATEWMTQTSGIEPYFTSVPEGVEVCRRAATGKEAFILINHTTQTQQVSLPRAMTDALTSRQHSASIELPPRGVAVLIPA